MSEGRAEARQFFHFTYRCSFARAETPYRHALPGLKSGADTKSVETTARREGASEERQSGDWRS